MKQVIHGMFLGTIFIFTIVCVIMVESRTNREANVRQSLETATKTAVQKVLEEQAYTIDSNEQFVAAVAQVVCDDLISNSEVKYNGDNSNPRWTGTNTNDNTVPDPNLKLTFEIVKADFAKGLLCLNVVEEFTNPIGTVGTCEYATTVIFDEAQNYDQYTIQYYNANNVLVASFIAKEGDDWPYPSQNLINLYRIGSWGSGIGATGVSLDSLNIPTHKNGKKYVPFAHMTNNMSSYVPFYDETSKTMKIYGNYTGA